MTVVQGKVKHTVACPEDGTFLVLKQRVQVGLCIVDDDDYHGFPLFFDDVSLSMLCHGEVVQSGVSIWAAEGFILDVFLAILQGLARSHVLDDRFRQVGRVGDVRALHNY